MSLFTESLREVYRPEAASWEDKEAPLNPLHIFFGYRSRYKRMPYVDITVYLFCLTWLIAPVVNLLKGLTLLPLTMAKNYFRDKKRGERHSSTLSGKLRYGVYALGQLIFSLLTTALSMILTPTVFSEKLLHFLKCRRGNEFVNLAVPGFFLALPTSILLTALSNALSNRSVHLFFFPILGPVGWSLGIIWTVLSIAFNATLLPMIRILSGENEQTLLFSDPSNDWPIEAMKQVEATLAKVGGGDREFALAQLKAYLENRTPGLSFKEVTLREFIVSQFTCWSTGKEKLEKILESFEQKRYSGSSSTTGVVGRLGGRGGVRSVEGSLTAQHEQSVNDRASLNEPRRSRYGEEAADVIINQTEINTGPFQESEEKGLHP